MAEGSQCFSGTVVNQTFKRILENSPSPLVAEFRKLSKVKVSEGSLGCGSGLCDQTQQKQDPLRQILLTTKQIPKVCIDAALKRKISQSSIVCEANTDGTWKTPKNYRRLSGGTPCIDDTTSSYIQHITNKVISCFQGLPMKGGATENINPKVLYSKLNNESGFNFTFNSKGGVGAGQLTSIATQEMNILDPRRTGGRVVKGNGRYILENIISSTNPDCQELKPVIQDDLEKKRFSPRKNTCDWTSLETGLARNLIYSTGYFSHIKHDIIGKELRKRAPTAYADPEVLDLLALRAYWRGPGAALTAIRTMGMNSRSTASIKAQLKQNTYVKAVNNKLGEIRQLSGGACQY